jgi:uncharacterized membrane protein YgcG
MMSYTAVELVRAKNGATRARGLDQVLPKLTPAPGFTHLYDLQNLLSMKERERLNSQLREMTTQRRRAEARTGKLRLS